MPRKTKRPVKTSPSADLIAGVVIGAIGIALIVIGASTLHFLIAVGILLIFIALILADILFP